MEIRSTDPGLCLDGWSFSYASEQLEVLGLYDRGTAERGEDASVFKQPFVAIADGTSGVYHPKDGYWYYNDQIIGIFIDTKNQPVPS